MQSQFSQLFSQRGSARLTRQSDHVATALEPLSQALYVGGLASAINAFKTDKPRSIHKSLTFFGQTTLVLVDCLIVLVQ